MLNILTIKKDEEYCTLIINGIETKSAKSVWHLLNTTLNIGMMREFKGDIILNYSREKSLHGTNFQEYTKEQFLIDEKNKREKREKEGILRFDTDWFYWLKENRNINFDIEGFINRWIENENDPFYIEFDYDNATYRMLLGDWIAINLEDINDIYLICVKEVK